MHPHARPAVLPCPARFFCEVRCMSKITFFTDNSISLSDFGFVPSDSCEFAVFPGFCDVHVHLRENGFSY